MSPTRTYDADKTHSAEVGNAKCEMLSQDLCQSEHETERPRPHSAMGQPTVSYLGFGLFELL